jgi:hypothetical protein
VKYKDNNLKYLLTISEALVNVYQPALGRGVREGDCSISHYYGINRPAMADFKLPTCSH